MGRAESGLLSNLEEPPTSCFGMSVNVPGYSLITFLKSKNRTTHILVLRNDEKKRSASSKQRKSEKSEHKIIYLKNSSHADSVKLTGKQI